MRLPWRKYVYVQEYALDNAWSRRRVLHDYEKLLVVARYDFGGRSVMFLSPDGTVEGDPTRHWREV